MKHSIRITMAALFCLFAVLFLGAIPAFAEVPATATTAKTTGNLRMHKTKDTNKSSTIQVIPEGKVVIIRSRESDNWFQVLYAGKLGYVKGGYLTENEDVRKTTAALRLRMTPDTKTKENIVLVMAKGSTVEIVEKIDSTWAWVSYKDKFGYAAIKYLVKENAEKKVVKVTSAALRMRKTMSTKTKKNIMLVIPKGNQVELISEQENGWMKIQYDGKTGYVKGKYLKNGKESAADEGVVKVMGANVKVRTSKSTASKKNVIGVVKKGKTVTVLAQEGNWCKIKYKGREAYIHGGYFSNKTGKG